MAAQLLKQVTTVSSHGEVSKEVLAKMAELQQQCTGLQTTLVEVRCMIKHRRANVQLMQMLTERS